MWEYFDVLCVLSRVLCYYLFVYIGLTFNSNFQKFQYKRQIYMVKNIVKSILLAYMSIYSTIDFITFVKNDYFDKTIVNYYASLYVANDLLALLLVPNLPKTTEIHHKITSFLLLYTLNVDFNDIQNVGKLLFIYTILSSYTFLVNMYLGIRFLENESSQIHINTIIEYNRISAYYIYLVCCCINWSIHISIYMNRLYNHIFNIHYFIYGILLFFIIKDDLILMSWLKKKCIKQD